MMKMRKIIAAFLITAFIVPTVNLSASADTAPSIAPKVFTNANPPPSPDGNFYVNHKGISFTYKGVRYWVFDDYKNPMPGTMLIGAYDINKNLLGTCLVDGARYLDSITVDSDAQKVIFNAQGTSSISWSDLEKLAAPKIDTTVGAPSSQDSDFYPNSNNISLTYKGVRYFIYDDKQNPWPGVMRIDAYDETYSQFLGTCKVVGARYLSSATVDSDAQTVTFNGQGTSSISWRDLEKLAAPQISTTATPPRYYNSNYHVNTSNISIFYKGFRFWIYDYTQVKTPVRMLILAYPLKGYDSGISEIIGTKCINSISVDSAAQTMTLTGDGTVTMSWYDLDSVVRY